MSKNVSFSFWDADFDLNQYPKMQRYENVGFSCRSTIASTWFIFKTTPNIQYIGLKCNDDVVGHGETHPHADHPAQRSPWLKLTDVDDRVQHTSVKEHLEMDKGGRYVRSCGTIEESKDHEREDVLQVVPVSTSNSFNIVVGYQRSLDLLRVFGLAIFRIAEGLVLEAEDGGQRCHQQDLEHEQGAIEHQCGEHFIFQREK